VSELVVINQAENAAQREVLVFKQLRGVANACRCNVVLFEYVHRLVKTVLSHPLRDDRIDFERVQDDVAGRERPHRRRVSHLLVHDLPTCLRRYAWSALPYSST
jgi:hypothetical protein